MERRFHPAANLFPMLSGDAMESLAESIKGSGLIHPIVMHDGMILDGRNRFVACRKAGIEPRFVEFAGGDPFKYVWDANAERRHLEQFQRAALAVKFASESGEWRAKQQAAREAANRARSDSQKGVSKADASERAGSTEPRRSEPKQARAIAESSGCSVATIKRADELRRKAPEQFEAVCAGSLPGRKALTEVKRQERIGKIAAIELHEPRPRVARVDVLRRVRLSALLLPDGPRHAALLHDRFPGAQVVVLDAPREVARAHGGKHHKPQPRKVGSRFGTVPERTTQRRGAHRFQLKGSRITTRLVAHWE